MPLYEQLQENMEPVYAWVKEQVSHSHVLFDSKDNCYKVQTYLPQEYKKLCEYTENLPLDDPPPSPPFAGLVYNINVVTGIHRDWNDDSICFVLVISKCEGGDLLLVEPGLVIELENGDGIAFRSAEITHLNMETKGYRASIVFHSDIHSKAWNKDFNGWKNNAWFRHSKSLETMLSVD